MAEENEGLDPDFKGPDTEGYERVDTTQLPPNIARTIEARLGRYHRQTKEGQKQIRELKATMEQMAKDNRALFDRLNAGETEEVKAGIKDAFEKGDADGLDRLTTRLVDIKSKPAAEKPPEKAESKPDDPPDLSDFLTAEEEALFLDWAAERSDTGPLRPWLHENHPKYKRAMAMLQGVLEDEEVRAKGAKAVMEEIDRMMGVAKSEVQPQPVRRVGAVLASGAAPVRTAGPKLSNEQKRAAELMGVSQEAYAKSLAATPRTSDGRAVYVREYDGDSRK